jgi:ferredoxin
VRIRPDKTRCIGSGNCVRLLPALFDQDDDGLVAVLDEGEFDAALQAQVAEVVESCPTSALRLES